MNDKLPPELRRLIEAEAKLTPTDAVRKAVRARLPGAAAGAITGVSALKILLVVVVASSAIAVATQRSRTSRPVDITTALEDSSPVVEQQTPLREIAHEPQIASTPVPALESRSYVEAPEEAKVPTSPSEATLVSSAYRVLAQGDAQQALALVDEAAQLPAPKLAEERETIRIRALAALGRLDEAKELAARFSVAYPGSIHKPALDLARSQP